MSTNAKGRYFISYRRSPARSTGTLEAGRIREALTDRGVPTWRDIEDLRSEPTESQLIGALTDTDTAGAVMLVSREVACSPAIRNVEIPQILKRHMRGDGFVVVPVLVGLEYVEANVALGAAAGLQNLEDWNLTKLEGNGVSEGDARAVARDVLRARLGAIAETSGDAALDVGLFSRRAGGAKLYALRHDFSEYFDGRSCRAGAYSRIECALVDTAAAIASVQGEANIMASGNAALPLGLLYGAVFTPLAGFRVSWLQGFAGQEDEVWSVSSGQSSIGLEVKETMGDFASEDMVLALSVSANIENAVGEYLRAEGLRPRTSIHAMPKDGPVLQGRSLSREDGLAIVLQAVEAVRTSRDNNGLNRARLHLFLACPLGMAVVLGQKLNTFAECCLYEHDPMGAPSYIRVHTFSPSSLSFSDR